MSNVQYKDFFDTYNDQTNQSKETQFHYWVQYMEQHKEIKHQCINDYEQEQYNHKDVALKKVFTYNQQAFSRMKEVSKYVTHTISLLQNPNFITIPNITPYLIIYHGLGNGAGWATTYKNQPAILLGVEKIVELNWDNQETINNLIFHEYMHLVHEALRGDLLPHHDHRRWIDQFYIEGFATYYETFFTSQKRRETWYQQCREVEPKLKQIYLQNLQNQESCQAFYGDWYQIEGLSDTGYYLGSKFIESLAKTKTANEIAVLPFEEIKTALYQFLKE